jgi:hypothetical protein
MLVCERLVIKVNSMRMDKSSSLILDKVMLYITLYSVLLI